MAEILWHRRETRRKQRKQTLACSHGRSPVYSTTLKDAEIKDALEISKQIFALRPGSQKYDLLKLLKMADSRNIS
jgi:hypothetical protein